jgi:hypothetical protein
MLPYVSSVYSKMLQDINIVWFQASEYHFCNIHKGDYVTRRKHKTMNMYDIWCFSDRAS